MKASLILFLGFTLPLLTGCSSKKVERVAKVYPVTGQVIWQGQPVADADVTFYNPDAKRSAFGRTNREGKYQLTTFGANDGAVAGRQIVTVSKIEAIVEAPVADVDSADYVPPETVPNKKAKKPGKPKSLIPEKFSSQNTSGLTAVIEESNRNVADLTLD